MNKTESKEVRQCSSVKSSNSENLTENDSEFYRFNIKNPFTIKKAAYYRPSPNTIQLSSTRKNKFASDIANENAGTVAETGDNDSD